MILIDCTLLCLLGVSDGHVGGALKRRLTLEGHPPPRCSEKADDGEMDNDALQAPCQFGPTWRTRQHLAHACSISRSENPS
jgi:hypothetical protein